MTLFFGTQPALQVSSKIKKDTQIGVICAQQDLFRTVPLLPYVLNPHNLHLQQKGWEYQMTSKVPHLKVGKIFRSISDVELASLEGTNREDKMAKLRIQMIWHLKSVARIQKHDAQ